MTTTVQQGTDNRAALIAGLRELAAFLADHPEVPFPPSLSCGANWWINGKKPDDAECIRRVEAWKELGFRDPWHTGNPGHHGVTLTFGAFELRLSHVEAAKARPIAWGQQPGESSEAFQARVDAALVPEAVTEGPTSRATTAPTSADPPSGPGWPASQPPTGTVADDGQEGAR